MAIFIAVMGKAGAPGNYTPLQVMEPVPSATEAITTSGTAQPTTITAEARDICRVSADGGAVWVAFGTSPVAASGTDHYVMDGQTLEFGPLGEGFKVSVVDA